jgi:hypothetical protein
MACIGPKIPGQKPIATVQVHFFMVCHGFIRGQRDRLDTREGRHRRERRPLDRTMIQVRSTRRRFLVPNKPRISLAFRLISS